MRIFEKLKKTFSKENKFVNQQKLYQFYELVANDIELGKRDEGVWAKAYTEEKGRELETNARYIKLMVDRLVLAADVAEEIQIKNNKLIATQGISDLSSSNEPPHPRVNRFAKKQYKIEKSASLKKLETETSEERLKRRKKERAEIAKLRKRRLGE